MKRNSILRATIALSLLIAGGAYAAEMTMYSGPGFHGSQMTVNGGVRDLDRTGFNDRAASIIVRSGRWEVCTDANFSGYCRVLVPGQYSALESPLYRQISSVRELGPVTYNEPYYRAEPAYVPPPAYNPGYVPYEDRGRYSALELYSLPGFRGDTMNFDRDATSLDKSAAIDNGVSSLIVREGSWELCTGIYHDGQCRVFDPGRYPRLGSFEGSPVGSLRRVG